MTTREDLIRQRDAIDARLAKLDATPWEEREADGLEPTMPVLVENEELLDNRRDEMAVDELWHVAYIYNAHPQLIACVRALRAMMARWDDFTRQSRDADLFEAATKALEELDAL